MFEQASKKKIRFAYRGSLTTEDLWDLTLTELNEIYIKLAKTKKADASESLINPREDSLVTLQMEIVKHIFDVKTADAAAARNRAAKKIRQDLILDAINKKETDGLLSKSLDELRAELAADEAEQSAIG